MQAVYCDPEVMRFIPGGSLVPGDVRRILDRHVAANEDGDVGFYAVEERASGAVVGEVGFGIFDTGEREIGWTLARAFWGRGFATEAVRECLAADARPLVAVIDPENEPSLRLAERVGLRMREQRVVRGRAHVVYET